MFHLIDCIFTRLIASSSHNYLIWIFTVRRFLDGKSAFLVRFSFGTDMTKVLDFFRGVHLRILSVFVYIEMWKSSDSYQLEEGPESFQFPRFSVQHSLPQA